MADVPEVVNRGVLTGDLRVAGGDSLDEGMVPDEEALQGTVVATPVGLQDGKIVDLRELWFPSAKLSYWLDDVVIEVVNGVFYPPGTGELAQPPETPGAGLVANDQPAGNPTSFAWLLHANIDGYAFRDRIVHVPADGAVDWSEGSLLAPLPGTIAVVSETSRVAAETAAAQAQESATSAQDAEAGAGEASGAAVAAAGDAESARDAAVAARDTTLGYRDAAQSAATAAAAVARDTGRRDVSGLLLNGAVKGGGAAPAGGPETSELRRYGQMVTLKLSLSVPAWTSGTPVFQLPPGFRMPGSQLVYLPAGYGGASGMAHDVDGNLRYYSAAANPGLRFLWTWMTSDPWPTTLPGVAA